MCVVYVVDLQLEPADSGRMKGVVGADYLSCPHDLDWKLRSLLLDLLRNTYVFACFIMSLQATLSISPKTQLTFSFAQQPKMTPAPGADRVSAVPSS